MRVATIHLESIYIHIYNGDINSLFLPIDDNFINIFIDPENCNRTATNINRIKEDNDFKRLKEQYEIKRSEIINISNTRYLSDEEVTDLEDLRIEVEERIEAVDRYYKTENPPSPTTEVGKKGKNEELSEDPNEEKIRQLSEDTNKEQIRQLSEGKILDKIYIKDAYYKN